MDSNLITAYFAGDHDRLDNLFLQFQKFKHADSQRAKIFFGTFRNGLKRHIKWEEEILFPLFEKKSGVGKGMGPTAVMLREHEMLQDILNSLNEKVQKADPASEEQEKALLEILGQHNMKEERVLYPSIDQLASEEDAADIFVAMEKILDDRSFKPKEAATIQQQSHEPLVGQPQPINQLADYQAGSIVSTRIIQKPTGNVTAFAFDEGQELSEHTAPFDALLAVVDGGADVMVGGAWRKVAAGEAIILPANVSHAVKAVARFKMILTMIRS